VRRVLLDGDEPAGIGGTRDKREAQAELTIAMGGRRRSVRRRAYLIGMAGSRSAAKRRL